MKWDPVLGSPRATTMLRYLLKGQGLSRVVTYVSQPCSKDAKLNHKRKDIWESRGIHRKSSLSLLSVRVYTDHTFPPATKMQQHGYNVSAQESSLEPWHPRFLSEVGHVTQTKTTDTPLTEGKQEVSSSYQN